MTKHKLHIFLCLILFFIQTNLAYGKEPYRNILVLGANRPFSNGDSSISTIFAYYHYFEDFENPELYGEFASKTTDTYFKFGRKTDKSFAGIEPVLSYFWYGGYEAYYEGVSDESRRYWGNSAGTILFFQYNCTKFFSTVFAYRPDYKFYSKGFFDTEINLPHNHIQQLVSGDISFDNVEKKDLNRIKHGILLKMRYEYARRTGYGTFKDTDDVEDSSVNNTQKLYFTGGFYYNAENNINIQFDLRGCLQKNTDRNNAEKIGFMLADHAVIPGYNAAEFYHNRYIVTGINSGFPLHFLSSRIKPGFNILYMPEKNNVTGVPDYSKRFYKSISCGFSTMAGGILPLFIDYGYGIDAERKGKKGNHELQVFFMTAFGKNE